MANFCVKCGSSNAPGARFCGGCGAGMAAAPAAPAPAPVHPPAPTPAAPQPPVYQQPYAPPAAPQPYAPPPQAYAPPPQAYAPPPAAYPHPAAYPPPAAYGAPAHGGAKGFPMGIVLAVLLIGGAGFGVWWFFFRSPSAGKTPQATFEAAKQCIVKEDFGAMYDLLSPNLRKQIDDQFNTVKEAAASNPSVKDGKNCPQNIDTMTPREFIAWAGKKAWEQMSPEERARQKTETQSSVVEKVDVNGDRATVYVKSPKGTDKVSMLCVDGKWYLDEFIN